MEITLTIPDSLAGQLTANEEELSQHLLEDIAVEAYCRDAISRHDLQFLLRLDSRYELDGFLKQRGIEHGSYSGQNLLQDIAALDAHRPAQR